jgi:hypothetical protein
MTGLEQHEASEHLNHKAKQKKKNKSSLHHLSCQLDFRPSSVRTAD